MFRFSHLRMMIRSLRGRSLFVAINVVGLSIGIASVLIIVAYIKDELSYDKFHSQYERIYRVTLDWLDDGKRTHLAAAESALAEVLDGKVAGVEKITRIYPIPGLISINQIDKNREQGFFFADSTFFEIFDLEFLQGNPEEALKDPMAVVITETKARAYFGSTTAVGKDIYYESESEQFTFHVTGVIKDFPTQSHFKGDFIASFHSLSSVMPWYRGWYYPQMYTYLLTGVDVEMAKLERDINEVARANHPARIKDGERTYYLQRITDIHLKSSLSQEWEPNSSYSSIILFATIAAFILLIACINFMNLSTAQATTRAKEVGLRKVMGALRAQLIRQFMGEALLITFLSFVVGFVIAEWFLLGGLNKMIDKELTLDFLSSGPWLVSMVGVVIVVGVCSGFYPSLFLSKYRPVKILSGSVEEPGRGISLRKGLVISQYIIATALIIFTWVVLNQNDYMLNKDPGFDQEHLIAVHLSSDEAKSKYNVFKNALLSNPGVIAASLSSALPGNDQYYGFSIVPEGQENELTLKTLGVDEDYLKTYDLKLVMGRDFSSENKSDEDGAYIINEAAMKWLGWNEPVGKGVTFVRHTNKREEKKGKIIGVVKDFHFKSLHHKVEPLLIYVNRHLYYAEYLSVRFKDRSPLNSVKLLKKEWESFIPHRPFEYSFLDEQLDGFYDGEVKRARILTSFASLSIFISCLGLFGLATFLMHQRRKEIGIRKVLGASITLLFRKFSFQFLKLVLIANVIAWPLAWYFAEVWLSNFAYRTSLSLSIFVSSLLATCGIALMTIAFQVLAASRLNPINILREN